MRCNLILATFCLLSSTCMGQLDSFPFCESKISRSSGFSLDGDLVVANALWDIGERIDVYFVNGSKEQREKVREIFNNKWRPFVNLEFDFHINESVDKKRADVCVEFWAQAGGKSFLGTYSRAISRTGKPSMFLPNSVNEPVVIHEFGHALALHHEHQSPNSKFRWNREFVLADAKKRFSWDEDTVEYNIFSVRSSSPFSSAYDPKSVMLYPFPKEWTVNGVSTSLNETPSAIDKKGVSSMYPKTFALMKDPTLTELNKHPVPFRTQCFRWAVDRGYAAGIPNYEQLNDKRGIICFPHMAVIVTRATASDLKRKDSRENIAAHRWAIANGFLAGFLNGEQQKTGNTMYKGVICLRKNTGKIAHVGHDFVRAQHPHTTLETAIDRYAKDKGFLAGIPTGELGTEQVGGVSTTVVQFAGIYK